MLSAPVDFVSRFHGIHENNTLSTWTRVEDLGYQVHPWIAKIYSVIFDSSNCSSDFNWRIRKFNAEILILVWGHEYAEKIIIQSLFPKSLGFPHQFKKLGNSQDFAYEVDFRTYRLSKYMNSCAIKSKYFSETTVFLDLLCSDWVRSLLEVRICMELIIWVESYKGK